MAAENLQTSAIGILDGYPFTGVNAGSQTGRVTSGQGAAARLVHVEGYVKPTTAATSGSYYQMVRVPRNAIIKKVIGVIFNGLTSTFTADVTVAFSDSTIDGTAPSNQVVPSGLTTTTNAYIVNPSASTTGLTGTASYFAYAEAFGGFTNGVPVELTFLNAGSSVAAGTSNPVTVNQPLWQGIGFSEDPGGFFDIVLFTTATNSVSSVSIFLTVEYALPGQ